MTQRAVVHSRQLPAFQRLKKTAATLEDAAIFAQLGKSVSPDGDHPRIVGAVIGSPNLFRLLGVQPILGRDFIEDDARQNAESVVILSYEGWQTLFARDPAVIGATLRIGGHPVTRHRCAAAGNAVSANRIGAEDRLSGYRGGGVLLFEPLAPSEHDLNRDMGNFNYKAIARLKPGVTSPRRTLSWRPCKRRTRSPRICLFISELRSRR